MSSSLDERGAFEQTAQVVLPEGVSPRAWNDEKMQVQNPRIRAFLVCIKRLEGARESNYAILHCSPARLLEILTVVQEVGNLIRTAVEPLVRIPSCIPELEVARGSTELYLSTIEKDVLVEVDRYRGHMRESGLGEVRRMLCVAIGKLHAFLVDSQSHLLAADPRNTRDADYFLSRKVPKDVEEAEWLHASVLRLVVLVEELEIGREAALTRPAAQIAKTGRMPDPAAREVISSYLVSLQGTLIPRLRDTLTLKGIRVSEIELIEDHTTHVFADCTVAQELQSLADRVRAAAGATADVEAVLAARLAEVLGSMNRRLRDLGAFMSVWERGVAQRRALFLKRQMAGADRASPARSGQP
jgi:hypothetical protein